MESKGQHYLIPTQVGMQGYASHASSQIVLAVLTDRHCACVVAGAAATGMEGAVARQWAENIVCLVGMVPTKVVQSQRVTEIITVEFKWI